MTSLRRAFLAIATAFVFTYAAPTSSSHAADPDPVAGPSDWSGFHFGVHFGGAFGSSDYDLDLAAGPGGPYANDNIDLSGVLGGVLLGYNFQSNNIVYGIEIDASIGDVEGKNTFFPAVGIHFHQTTQGSLRLRVGYAMGNTLIYATGGGTLASVEVDQIGVVNATDEETQYGFIVGGGIEHKVSDAISIRGEYLYSHFFRDGYSHTIGALTFNDRSHFDTHTVRAAVVLHLGEIFGTR